MLSRARHRQALGQLHHAALAGAVGRGEGRAEDREHRTDVDDLAAAAALSRGIRGLRRDEDAGQVRLQHFTPFLERIGLGALRMFVPALLIRMSRRRDGSPSP